MSSRNISDIKEAIAGLEQLLDSGATMVTIDGETTQFDLGSATARLRDLKAELKTLQGKSNRRPMFNRIDLS